MTRFSTTYRTFTAWLTAKPRVSAYAKTIIRRHHLAPRSTLQLLRGASAPTLDRVTWGSLSGAQRADRIRSLDVLRLMRQGQPLKAAAKQYEISPQKVQAQLGRAIVKRGGHWVARRHDTIERVMKLYEHGRITSITVTNSKDASLIGEYFSAVQKALRTRDPHPLQKFKHLTITDASGKVHHFETRMEKIKDIEEAKENPEFFDIYEDD